VKKIKKIGKHTMPCGTLRKTKQKEVGCMNMKTRVLFTLILT
jgi:hypothetical protein